MPKLSELSEVQRQLLQRLWSAKAVSHDAAIEVEEQSQSLAGLLALGLIGTRAAAWGRARAWLTEKGQLTIREGSDKGRG